MIELRIKEIKLSKGVWKVIPIRIDFEHPEFERACEQARQKSQHTMAASQNGEVREQSVKYNMQLMGIIAEIACKKYLEVVLERNEISDWEIIRYDDVRTDGFKSGANEYDLKIGLLTDSEINYTVESRSSITHNKAFDKGLEQYDIIGRYSSIAKSGEEYNDLYLRPLYEYKDHNKKDYDRKNFEKLLLQRRIKLYLVAGCTIDDMKERGEIKNMNQGATKFQFLPIMFAKDIVDFQEVIVNLVKSDIKK